MIEVTYTFPKECFAMASKITSEITALKSGSRGSATGAPAGDDEAVNCLWIQGFSCFLIRGKYYSKHA